MSERVSEAVGPENGDDFLRKVSPTTQREWHQRRSQLLHSHGTPTFGAICKRSGQNTSSRSGDTKISARPNPHKYAAASTVKKWPLGIIRSHPTGGPGRGIIPAMMPVQEKEQLEGPQEKGHPPMPSSIRRRECNDPPPLTQEDEGTSPPRGFAFPSTEGNNVIVIEQWFSPATGLNVSVATENSFSSFCTARTSPQSTPLPHGNGMENGRNKETSMHDSSQILIDFESKCSRKDEQEESDPRYKDNIHEIGRGMMGEDHLNEMIDQQSANNTRTGIRKTMVNTLYNRKESSNAMQQLILLRRCFFPRRDVIRWDLFYEGCAVQEVHLLSKQTQSVLEPLKSLRDR